MKILFRITIVVGDFGIAILDVKEEWGKFIREDIKELTAVCWYEALELNKDPGVYFISGECASSKSSAGLEYKINCVSQMLSIQEYKAKYKSKNGILE